MENYIVSARKYRPENFETLIGQDNIARTLRNSILRGQLAHAYLFCGPRGVGKTTTARIFAKMINCSNPKEGLEPCGECESCKSFAEGRSYCIHELDAASNNGIEDIKALIDQVRIPPQVGKYSVYIIDEVHMLSQAAFNAFLKTLEEPPAHAIFILATTEKHKILPTILSRCQTYDFNRISVEDIVRNLRMIADREDISIDDESLHIIAQKADGAMRDALTVFDQTVAFCGTEVKYEDVLKNLNVLSYDHCFAMVEYFLSGDYASALLKFDEILSKGFNALHFVSALSSHFRDLVVSKSGGLDALLELPQSLKERYREQSGRCPMRFLYDSLCITAQCEAGYKASVNPRLHIEFALMRLSFLMNPPAGGPAVQPAARQAGPQAQTATAQVTSVQSAQPVQQALDPQAPDQSAQVQKASQSEPRRHRMGGPVFSVKEMAQETKKQSFTENARTRTDLPSEEEIKTIWPELAKTYAERQPRLANAILNSMLSVDKSADKVNVIFRVSNESQMKWIQSNILNSLEGRLRILLNSDKTTLSVDIVPHEKASAVPYTQEEKLNAIAGANPQVKELIHDLDAVLK